MLGIKKKYVLNPWIEIFQSKDVFIISDKINGNELTISLKLNFELKNESLDQLANQKELFELLRLYYVIIDKSQIDFYCNPILNQSTRINKSIRIQDLNGVTNKFIVIGFPFDFTQSQMETAHYAPHWLRKKFPKALSSSNFIDIGDLSLFFRENFKDFQLKIDLIFNQVLKNKNIPFSLGGDHSITYYILNSLKKHLNNITLIQFDAHTDCYGTDTSITRLNNANFVSYLLKNDIVEKIIQIGVREDFKTNQSGLITNPKISEIDKIIENTENIYISIDFDVFDPSIIPNVTTPEPNGITIKCLEGYLENIQRKKIIGIDLMELVAKKHNKKETLNNIEQILQLLNEKYFQ